MSPERLARYWQTVRWLRPVQVYGRLWLRLRRPRPDLRAAPPLRPHTAAWIRCARTASMTGPDSFRFLNVERRIAAASDWSRPDWPKLWLYNAHYFDDLVAADATARTAWHRAIAARWILENPPAQGAGWEPYPTSLRIVNWVKWALAGNALDESARQSLAVQTRFLGKRLEIHLLGNHLWANAKALVFAGTFFDGDEAAAWRARGLALLRRELEEQILPDGGHFERSPMYHAIVLADLLDLLQLARVYPGLLTDEDVAAWRETVRRMQRWLQVMTHPDGDISFFNDAALDIAPTLTALIEYAAALGVAWDRAPLAPIEALADSGYVRLQIGPAVLIADVGEIGPDHLPGHAHADTLSFELSLRGQRVLVNGGTSTYEVTAERLRQRGTAAHNTVVVDGVDSSEVWSSFRVGRRARPLAVAWGRDGYALWLSAGHDGYRRLPGKVIHRRGWRLDPEGLVVEDALEGRYKLAQARFQVLPGGEFTWTVEGASGRLAAATWHPRFGQSMACEVLSVTADAPVWTTGFRWQ
jgi:uncharacterized heparinase superfamily protein